jgi:tetratricopeptide (TPR) repeat protein
LAYTKIKTGDLGKATEMYNSILKTQEVQNGKESLEYNETLGLLGLVLTLQQKYSQALSCLSVALKWQEDHLGATHPSVQYTKGLVKKISRLSRGGASEWI